MKFFLNHDLVYNTFPCSAWRNYILATVPAQFPGAPVKPVVQGHE